MRPRVDIRRFKVLEVWTRPKTEYEISVDEKIRTRLQWLNAVVMYSSQREERKLARGTWSNMRDVGVVTVEVGRRTVTAAGQTGQSCCFIEMQRVITVRVGR